MWGRAAGSRRQVTRVLAGEHCWASSPLRSAAGCWVLPVRRRAPARHHLLLTSIFVAVLRIIRFRSGSSS